MRAEATAILLFSSHQCMLSDSQLKALTALATFGCGLAAFLYPWNSDLGTDNCFSKVRPALTGIKEAPSETLSGGPKSRA